MNLNGKKYKEEVLFLFFALSKKQTSTSEKTQFARLRPQK